MFFLSMAVFFSFFKLLSEKLAFSAFPSFQFFSFIVVLVLLWLQV